MGQGVTPEYWCAKQLPLLHQFLMANDDRFRDNDLSALALGRGDCSGGCLWVAGG